MFDVYITKETLQSLVKKKKGNLPKYIHYCLLPPTQYYTTKNSSFPASTTTSQPPRQIKPSSRFPLHHHPKYYPLPEKRSTKIRKKNGENGYLQTSIVFPRHQIQRNQWIPRYPLP